MAADPHQRTSPKSAEDNSASDAVAVLKSHLRASWVEVNSRDILVSAHATGVTFQMLSHSRFARGQTLNPVDFDLSGRFRREVNLRYSFGEVLTLVPVFTVLECPLHPEGYAGASSWQSRGAGWLGGWVAGWSGQMFLV